MYICILMISLTPSPTSPPRAALQAPQNWYPPPGSAPKGSPKIWPPLAPLWCGFLVRQGLQGPHSFGALNLHMMMISYDFHRFSAVWQLFSNPVGAIKGPNGEVRWHFLKVNATKTIEPLRFHRHRTIEIAGWTTKLPSGNQQWLAGKILDL